MMLSTITCRRREPKATRNKTSRLTLPLTKFQELHDHRGHDHDEDDCHGDDQEVGRFSFIHLSPMMKASRAKNLQEC